MIILIFLNYELNAKDLQNLIITTILLIRNYLLNINRRNFESFLIIVEIKILTFDSISADIEQNIINLFESYFAKAYCNPS